MELREYIRKYQGKCYKYEDGISLMYVRIVKIGNREDPIHPYFTIYEFVTHFIKDGNWNLHTENISDITVPQLEEYGWKRITKSDYKTAKNKCLRSQPKYIEKNG